ncbi:hypothetical protein GCM10023235_22780 [Kitasatospora terrestris]|uniref:Uncharacterized protein n=1 Tax=Kitasatospora terrestris TaxID=258051 RepID=A0ABP9DI81_9ACTN
MTVTSVILAPGSAVTVKGWEGSTSSAAEVCTNPAASTWWKVVPAVSFPPVLSAEQATSGVRTSRATARERALVPIRPIRVPFNGTSLGPI